MTATILVVDDLEPNVKLLEAKLLSEYYIVYTASNGKDAIEALKEKKIDIILLDVMMPGMDGFEVCKIIKNNPDTLHIPIIMVTALSEVENKIKGLEAGADEFLTKPVNDVELFARVKSLARIKVVVDELRLRNRTNSELGLAEITTTNDFSLGKILIIDNDVIQSNNIATYLKKLTSNLKIIENYANINQAIEVFPPDLMLLSCQITPDPLRICAQIRTNEQLKNIPLVLFGDEEDMPIIIKGMEMGVYDYFLYPIDENELVARVKTQIRKKFYQDSLKNILTESINMSFKDSLTDIFNRRYFDVHLKQMIINASSKNESLMMIMIDIDHFKKINDLYGHQAGDEILKIFANIIKNCTRLTDFVARYGGEEFVMVLYDVKKEYALSVANRIKQEITHPLKIKGIEESLSLSVSLGVAIYKPNQTQKDFIETADKALYQAKNQGRNRIIVAEENREGY